MIQRGTELVLDANYIRVVLSPTWPKSRYVAVL